VSTVGALVSVDAEYLGARRAGVPLDLSPKEGWHTSALDVTQVLDEAVVVHSGVSVFYDLQALAREVLALMAEVDLLFGELRTEPFLVNAAASTRATSGTIRPRRIQDPTTEVAVHPAGGDEFSSHSWADTLRFTLIAPPLISTIE